MLICYPKGHIWAQPDYRYELLASSSLHPNLGILGIVPPSELRERTDPETCKCDGCTVLDTPATTLSMPVIAVMAPTATLIKQAR